LIDVGPKHRRKRKGKEWGDGGGKAVLNAVGCTSNDLRSELGEEGE